MHGDAELKALVLAELAFEPSVTEAHIGVTADEGVLTLSGHVASLAEKHAAEVAAGRVKGVRAVVGDMEVNLAGDHRRDDGDIARAAVRALAWQADDPDCSVAINLEKGRIVLTGQVARQSQREDAESDLRRLPGLVSLDNQLTIKPQVCVANLADAITHAMNRSWFFDPDNIDVTAKRGSVRLTGTVHTPHDKYIAGTTAWAAPGVTDVSNDIRVI